MSSSASAASADIFRFVPLRQSHDLWRVRDRQEDVILAEGLSETEAIALCLEALGRLAASRTPLPRPALVLADR